MLSWFTPDKVGCVLQIGDQEAAQDLVRWTVIVSGVCTILQCSPCGQLSSNLLSIMGTSSAFIGVVGLTGKQAAPGDGIPLIMRMNLLTFWAETAFIYFLPQSFIEDKLLDPTVKESVVITIGLTLTQGVGTRDWIGDGHAADALIGLLCVLSFGLLTRVNQMREQPKWLCGFPLGRFALVLTLLIGWGLHSFVGNQWQLDAPDFDECSGVCADVGEAKDPCLDSCSSAASLSSCVMPTPPDGYDLSGIVDDALSRSKSRFNVTGITCMPGYGTVVDEAQSSMLVEWFGVSSVGCICDIPGSGACACPCKYGGDAFKLTGCEANQNKEHQGLGTGLAFMPPPAGEDTERSYAVMPTASLLIPWFITRLASSLESIGDITATAALSGKKTDGRKFQQRLRGGLTMDALSGLIGACCGGLPLTTLSQNNGLISQAGWHDWRGGLVAGTMLIITGIGIGLMPPKFVTMKHPMLAACLMVIFATIAVGGFQRLFKFSRNDERLLRNLDAELARRAFITAAAVGIGIGSEMHAKGLSGGKGTFLANDWSEAKALAPFRHWTDPVAGEGSKHDEMLAEQFPMLQCCSIILSSGVATTTLSALLLNFVWPKDKLNKDERKAAATAAAVAPKTEGGRPPIIPPLELAPAAASLETVLECVRVNTWLIKKGLGVEADTILQSFAQAGIPVDEWLPELTSMSDTELRMFTDSARSHINVHSSDGNGNGGGNGSAYTQHEAPAPYTVSENGASGVQVSCPPPPAAPAPAPAPAAAPAPPAEVPGADFVAARRLVKLERTASQAAAAAAAGSPPPPPQHRAEVADHMASARQTLGLEDDAAPQTTGVFDADEGGEEMAADL